MMLVSLISYIDRNTLALLAPTILAETGLSNEQYGWVVSAFSITYMLGNPVWGVLLDRFGVRSGMLWAVGAWSVASASHAFAGGFLSFAAARAALGFGEGATFPGGLRTASVTLPSWQRARGTAVAYSGGALGAIVTPILMTPVALRWGWRGAFLFTGVIGAAWLGLWWLVRRKVPHHVPKRTGQRTSLTSLRHPAAWAFVASYALGALPLAFVLYASAIYLGKVRRLTQAEIGALLWIPPVGWEIGYFVWGWAADRFGPLSGMRSRALFACLAAASLPLALVPRISDPRLLMVGLLFASFVAAGFIMLSIAYATEVFAADSSGLIAGIGAGSWSAAVALFMPVVGRLFDNGQFETAFALSAAIPVLGCAIWWGFDSAARQSGL
jgi:MFS transporter, ACS family, hexuronate transporter